MRDVIHRILDDPLPLFIIIAALGFASTIFIPAESSQEKSLRLYKECMETQNADKQTCKEIAGIESNSGNN